MVCSIPLKYLILCFLLYLIYRILIFIMFISLHLFKSQLLLLHYIIKILPYQHLESIWVCDFKKCDLKKMIFKNAVKRLAKSKFNI
jgi:hypothetical protein